MMYVAPKMPKFTSGDKSAASKAKQQLPVGAKVVWFVYMYTYDGEFTGGKNEEGQQPPDPARGRSAARAAGRCNGGGARAWPRQRSHIYATFSVGHWPAGPDS